MFSRNTLVVKTVMLTGQSMLGSNAWMNDLGAHVTLLRLLLVGSCLHFIFFFDLFPFLPANFLGQSFHHCSLSLFTFHNSKHQTT
jgi:hypothetical protein